jgi:hypothetical protein
MPWFRQDLAEKGFEGFVRFADLPGAAVPRAAGVYVVIRESDAPPDFVPVSHAGRFKGRDPTVPIDVLADKWVNGAHLLYVGKAGSSEGGNRGLRRRLDEYRKFGEGRAVGHNGGRYIWQLRDSSELLVAWRVTPPGVSPREVEKALMAAFTAHNGRRPFANLRD